MGEMQEDVLGWLLPAAPIEEERHARRLVTFLRLLRDDARGRGAEVVGFDLERARLELKRGDQLQKIEAMGDLLRYYLNAALPRDSFLYFGEPRLSFQRAWGHLSGLEVPGPGESSLDVAGRILDHARDLGAGRRWLLVWRTRHSHVRLGFDGAKAAWNRLNQIAKKSNDDSLGAVALLGLVQGALDRGDPKSAGKLLERSPKWVQQSFDLRRCRVWVALVLGNAELAKPLSQGLRVRGHGLPLPLAELRVCLPDWAPWLTGVARTSGVVLQVPASVDHRSLGASALGILRLDRASGILKALQWKTNGAGQRRLGELQRRRRGAWTRAGEPEHRALVLGQTVVQHFESPGPHACALFAASLSLALVPIRDAAGDPDGWLHLEYDHHLLPSLARLEALAEYFGRTSLAACDSRARVASKSGSLPLDSASPGADGQLARAALELLRRLPMGVSARRAVLFDCPRRAAPIVAATLGGGLADQEACHGRALQRVLDASAVFAFHTGRGAGCFARAGSGILAPLIRAGRLLAVISVESPRRGNFSGADLGKLEDFASEHAGDWQAAQFESWHGREFDRWANSPLGCAWWQHSPWEALAASDHPLFIAGEPKTGKLGVCRWIHHGGCAEEQPFVDLDCRVKKVNRIDLERAWSAACGGSFCVRHPMRLTHTLQRMLASWSREGGAQGETSSVRLMATGREFDACKGLQPELAALFAPLGFRLPPLRDRRDQIPRFVKGFLGAESKRAGLLPVELKDEAMALLWRQAWPGNLVELSSFMRRLVLLHSGGFAGCEELHAVAHGYCKALLRRLPSGGVARVEMEAALIQTRWANGRPNKTRAALYLGWDPDTLLSRLRSLGSQHWALGCS